MEFNRDEGQSEHQLPGTDPDGSRVWLPELVERFASFMHANDIPCALRLVNKATAAQFRDRQHTTVRLSQPVPHHAFAARWGAPGAARSLTSSQRYKLLHLTAISGCTANLDVAAGIVGHLSVRRAAGSLGAAGAAGQLDACRWLIQAGCPVKKFSACVAAAAGQREAVELLLASGAHWDGGLAAGAARGGHPDLVDWLLLRRPEGPLGPADSLQCAGEAGLQLFVCAAEGCSLAVLQALYRRGLDALLDVQGPGRRVRCLEALEAAVRSPTADWQAKVEWLEALEPTIREAPLGPCAAAAGRPDGVDRVKWLRRRGYPRDQFLQFDAVSAGNLALLEYCLEEGEGWRDMWRPVAEGAAHRGWLEALRLLLARGRLADPARVATAAAMSGHLPVLVWAEEELGVAVRDVPGIMTDAAHRGSVELLAWLAERGCGWDRVTFAAAAGSGCEEALEWLAERGCPMGEDGAPYLASMRYGADPPLLRCLQRLGCPWGPVGKVFAEYVHRTLSERDPACLQRDLACLERDVACLVEAGCPVDWEAALRTTRRTRQRTPSAAVPWLLQQWGLHLQQQEQQQQQQQQREQHAQERRRWEVWSAEWQGGANSS